MQNLGHVGAFERHSARGRCLRGLELREIGGLSELDRSAVGTIRVDDRAQRADRGCRWRTEAAGQ